ncbi:hypothetical protein TRFO_05031 [Tritrichomonas foetus]|uniref:BACK domain-containing protein n=1 Tax=Tritrichomonas foetus TaxID=1144522 RepID=A0A1J4K934_9EUKA|nr:hypothetical protein TRFO_05031 [Tritrichomonas foetus]|eukprot:OHT07919.1 hypothetical protein TRFO_05031 [Tritrichomonas foetus]
MDEFPPKYSLSYTASNPYITKEEIILALEQFGPIKEIRRLKSQVGNIYYRFILFLIRFENEEGYNKALNSAQSQLTFDQLEGFAIPENYCFIVGPPKLDDLDFYSKMFSSFGVKYVTTSDNFLGSHQNEFILLAECENKASFLNFRKIIDKSYISGSLIRLIPIDSSAIGDVSYNVSMPNLKNSINSKFGITNNQDNYDFTLLYYDREYKVWSGSAIALSNTIAKAYTRYFNTKKKIEKKKTKSTTIKIKIKYSSDSDSDSDSDSSSSSSSSSSHSDSENQHMSQEEEEEEEEKMNILTEFIVPQIPGPFEIIVDYINGNQIQLNDTNAPFILLMAEKLGMKDLYIKAHRMVYECSDINSIAVMLEHLYNLDGNFNHLLALVANKFKSVCNTLTVRRYPKELLEMIISSKYFSIRNEDQLLEYINSYRSIDNKKYKYLLKQVRFDRLSNKTLLEMIYDESFDLNTIRAGLLHMSQQIEFGKTVTPTEPTSDPPKNVTTIHGSAITFGDVFRAENYEYQNGKLFCGIFENLRYFTDGANPHTAGIVELSASSTSHENVSILLDYNSLNWFGTQDTPESFIRVDFKYRRVSLTGYSLRTHSHDGNGHITGWLLSGSNDKETWTPIDSMPITDQFDALGIARYFPLQSPTPFYRYFELKQIRQNSMGYNNLRLSNIEFFGSVQHE